MTKKHRRHSTAKKRACEAFRAEGAGPFVEWQVGRDNG
jgi:hypothetical protein